MPKENLNLSWRRPLLSYENQSIDFQSKSMDWFHDNGLRHEWVKRVLELMFNLRSRAF